MRKAQGWFGRQVRTVFLSDVHLGSRHSQCDELLEFLDGLSPERLYIVGDFIDGWELKRSFRWLPCYSRLLLRLTALAERGTRLFYVPGNHDSFVKDQTLTAGVIDRLGFVEIADEFVFETADRRRFLVTHGDRFDIVEQSAQWLSVGTTGLYNTILSANWWLSRLMGRRGQSPYRLCAILKNRVKAAIRFISRFENLLIAHAKQQGCDGVICGHLHTPAIVHRDGVTYCNTGDWVENCTALLEYADGSLELEYYYPQAAADASRVPQPKPVVPKLAWPMQTLSNPTTPRIATWRSP